MPIQKNNGNKALKKAQDNAADLADIASAWSSWIPTIAWNTAIPTGVSVICLYKVIGKTIFVRVKIEYTDGNNTTGCTFDLPINPKANDLSVPVLFIQNTTNRYAFLMDDGVNNVIFSSMFTATGGSSGNLKMSVEYEID